MGEDVTPAGVLRELWRRVDATDWDGLARLLAPDVVVRYPHSGEVLDGPGWVALNRDYPGRWHAELLDLVAAADRAAGRARVHDGVPGGESHAVASFATVRGGLVVELVEVWAQEGADPARR